MPRRMTSWMRSIASVTKSAGYFGSTLLKAEQNNFRAKSSLVYSGMILGGSVLRLGAKVVDTASSYIMKRPKKGWGKKPLPKRTKNSNSKAKKPLTTAQKAKEVRKEIEQEKKGKKKQKEQPKKEEFYVPGNIKEPENSKDVPVYELNEKEKEMLSEWSDFNNRELEGVGGKTTHKNMSDEMSELYTYLEKTQPFIEKLEYVKETKEAKLTLKGSQLGDVGFFNEIYLNPTSIKNEEGYNYYGKDPSESMTNLLNDYHLERANILYLIVNHYYGKMKKAQ